MKVFQLLLVLLFALVSHNINAQNTFPEDGNVGIGTTTPVAKLEVNGNIKWNGYEAGNSRALKIGYSGGNYGGIAYNLDYTTSTGIFNRPLSDQSSYLELWYGGFRFYGTSDAVATNGINLNGGGSNLNLFATITSTGEFGIGTSSPGYKLDVKGNVRFTENLHLTSDNQEIQFYRNGANYGYLWSTEQGLHWGKGAVSNSITVDNSGLVGIGTATPREKLSVNGKIRAKEIKVETVNWPDYVFKPSYNPASLSELEKYINANKHLPEIPSASEAEEQGISLGEMNAKLLKKIEELTLYLIDQDKKNRDQSVQIKDLQGEVQTLKALVQNYQQQ